MKILVRNLAKATTEEKISSLFASYGAIQYCNLILDEKTGASKGFAFVEMPKAGEAKIAIQKLNGYKLAGNTIRVKKAENKKEPIAASSELTTQNSAKIIKKTIKTELSDDGEVKDNTNNALNIYGTPKKSD